jgi:hypothetical protein
MIFIPVQQIPSYPACMGNGCAHYMNLLVFIGKTFAETQHKVKTACLHFSYCMGVFIGDTADSWMKHFGYTLMQSQITLAKLQFHIF